MVSKRSDGPVLTGLYKLDSAAVYRPFETGFHQEEANQYRLYLCKWKDWFRLASMKRDRTVQTGFRLVIAGFFKCRQTSWNWFLRGGGQPVLTFCKQEDQFRLVSLILENQCGLVSVCVAEWWTGILTTGVLQPRAAERCNQTGFLWNRRRSWSSWCRSWSRAEDLKHKRKRCSHQHFSFSSSFTSESCPVQPVHVI